MFLSRLVTWNAIVAFSEQCVAKLVHGVLLLYLVVSSALASFPGRVFSPFERWVEKRMPGVHCMRNTITQNLGNRTTNVVSKLYRKLVRLLGICFVIPYTYVAGYFRGVYISRTAILFAKSNFTNGDTEPRLLPRLLPHSRFLFFEDWLCFREIQTPRK